VRLSRRAAFAYAIVMAAGAAFIGIKATAQSPNLTAQAQALFRIRVHSLRQFPYEPYSPPHRTPR
jgi:hypothetical protein